MVEEVWSLSRKSERVMGRRTRSGWGVWEIGSRYFGGGCGDGGVGSRGIGDWYWMWGFVVVWSWRGGVEGIAGCGAIAIDLVAKF